MIEILRIYASALDHFRRSALFYIPVTGQRNTKFNALLISACPLTQTNCHIARVSYIGNAAIKRLSCCQWRKLKNTLHKSTTSCYHDVHIWKYTQNNANHSDGQIGWDNDVCAPHYGVSFRLIMVNLTITCCFTIELQWVWLEMVKGILSWKDTQRIIALTWI